MGLLVQANFKLPPHLCVCRLSHECPGFLLKREEFSSLSLEIIEYDVVFRVKFGFSITVFVACAVGSIVATLWCYGCPRVGVRCSLLLINRTLVASPVSILNKRHQDRFPQFTRRPEAQMFWEENNLQKLDRCHLVGARNIRIEINK